MLDAMFRRLFAAETKAFRLYGNLDADGVKLLALEQGLREAWQRRVFNTDTGNAGILYEWHLYGPGGIPLDGIEVEVRDATGLAMWIVTSDATGYVSFLDVGNPSPAASFVTRASGAYTYNLLGSSGTDQYLELDGANRAFCGCYGAVANLETGTFVLTPDNTSYPPMPLYCIYQGTDTGAPRQRILYSSPTLPPPAGYVGGIYASSARDGTYDTTGTSVSPVAAYTSASQYADAFDFAVYGPNPASPSLGQYANPRESVDCTAMTVRFPVQTDAFHPYGGFTLTWTP